MKVKGLMLPLAAALEAAHDEDGCDHARERWRKGSHNHGVVKVQARKHQSIVIVIEGKT